MATTMIPAVTCANCGLRYDPRANLPPCPDGPNGPAGWSNEMLVFMRCTAGKPFTTPPGKTK